MQYEKSFKEEAVKLSDEIVLKVATSQFGLAYYTLSTWRINRKNKTLIHMLEMVIKEWLLIIKNNWYSNWKKKMLNSNIPMKLYRKLLVFGRLPKEVRAYQHYLFVYKRHNNCWSIKLMCKILGISTSGYYKYKNMIGKPSKDTILLAAMKFVMNESPFNENYGAPRMQLVLQQRGLKVEIRRIT